MLEKLQIFVSLMGALAVTIASIVGRATLYDIAVRLIYTIILFYLIGIFLKIYIKKNVFSEKIPKETAD